MRSWNSHSELVDTLGAAFNALRSYQYGNAETELAEKIADACEKAISKAEAIQ